MKNLKDFKSFSGANESLVGEFSRLNPKRYKNDVKGATLIQDIKNDFEKCGRDLRKVAFYVDDNEVSFKKLETGKNGKLSYVFGKYHPSKNNIFVASYEPGYREITISYIPTELVLKKNSLEIAFNSKRFQFGYGRVKDETLVENPDYNPNIRHNLGMETPTERERKMMVRFHENTEEYKISHDVADEILNYFIEEYKKQYPGMIGKYKNANRIDSFKKGIKQEIDSIYGRDINGEEVIDSYYEGENKKELLALMKTMTKEEYEKMRKNLKSSYYAESDKKEEIKKEKIRKEANTIITQLFKKYSLNVLHNEYGKDIEIRVNHINLSINFRLSGEMEQIKTTLNKLCSELPPIWNEQYEYKYTTHRVQESYQKDSTYFISINFETTEYD